MQRFFRCIIIANYILIRSLNSSMWQYHTKRPWHFQLKRCTDSLHQHYVFALYRKYSAPKKYDQRISHLLHTSCHLNCCKHPGSYRRSFPTCPMALWWSLEEHGVNFIIVEGIGETHEGLAVMNYIRKAASEIHLIRIDSATSSDLPVCAGLFHSILHVLLSRPLHTIIP